MRNFLVCLTAMSLLLAGTALQAQPVAFDPQVITGYKIYRDAHAPNVFYHDPLPFKLATDANGQPVFKLLQMRYTGTRATADNGNIQFRNILQMKIVVDDADLQQLQTVQSKLRLQRADAKLKPLPITKFESLLVYTPVLNSDSSLKILTGHTEAEKDAELNKSYWTERTFSIRLSDADAQLVETALTKKQAAVSVSYAFYTTFSAAQASSFTATVNNRINRQVMDYFDSSLFKNKDSLLANVMVLADAIPVSVDPQKWPEAIQKIDINEKLPPNYPLFDVYCYDFNNGIRPDLFAKQVEIKAMSVDGSEISYSTAFKSTHPDQYVQSIRFPFAVRFDKPYRYRTVEIDNNGEALWSAWTERKSWSDIIDITTQKNKSVQDNNQ